MSTLVDTSSYHDAICSAFQSDAGSTSTLEADYIPFDDELLMSEGLLEPVDYATARNPIWTVRNWAGWLYQKNPDGKWYKIAKSPSKDTETEAERHED